jgi:hypothetical protein
MKWLLAIAALLLGTASSQTDYGRDAARVLPSDRAPTMAYHWWQRASREERLAVIGTAIEGLRAGWAFGDIANRKETIRAFDRAYERKEVSRKAVEIAAQPRPMPPPVFPRPLEEYISKIDDAYARVPAMREQDVADVLLCFSESKIIDCRDANGRPLR